MQITIATPADFDSITPYLDTAYNFAPGFFSERLASQWNREGVDWSGVFVVRDDAGAIESLVRIWEMTLIQDGRRVVCGGIGSVSTLASARGQGGMSALIEHCNAEMKRRGYPLGILWGDRFRYASFGYEFSGHGGQFTVTKRGLKRCKVAPLAPRQIENQVDDALLAQIESARRNMPFYRERTLGEVPRIYRTPTRRVLSAGEGEEFGWLVLDEKKVVEWGGDVDTILGLTAGAIEAGIGEGFDFALPDVNAAPPSLLRAASGWSMGSQSCRAVIFDLPQTLQTFEIETPLEEVEKLDGRAQVWELFGRPDAPRNLWIAPIDMI